MAREMKNSGIEWIGEIPAGWSLRKVKSLFCIGRGRVISQLELEETGYPVYSSQTKNNGCLGYISTYDFDRSQLTWTTDGANAGTVFLREGKHNCTNVCGTLMPITYEHNLKYMKYALEFIAIYHKRADINGYKIMNNEMAEIAITLPTRHEQDKIASFLDQKCAEIDAVIEKTKATIEEYKKLKQSVITEAVTKGIRGNRPMKDSGIEWIGEIPVGWEIIPLQYFADLNKETLGENTSPEYEFDYVEIGAVTLEKGIGEYQHYKFSDAPSRARRVVYANDIIISTVRTYLKAIAIVPYKENLIVSTGFAVLTPKNIHTEYLGWSLKSDYFVNMVSSNSVGISYPAINASNLIKFKITIPSTDEQKEISDYLDQKCAEIDTLIAKKTTLLTELENYKKSLIYEYVTGKKEVGAVSDNTTITIVYPYFPAILSTDKTRFAQAVLMSKILDSNVKYMGRVKLEKMLFTIEHSLGFDFDTEYAREMAGPLDGSIYECEKIISRTNKWFYVNKSHYGTSYKPQKNIGKYKRYYEQYFSDYNEEIESIISVFKNYSLDQSEIIATLFAAWNDAIIDKKQFTDEDIVNDVLNNWHKRKKRFKKDVWLRAMEEMRKNNLIPKGYGKKTVIKKIRCKG